VISFKREPDTRDRFYILALDEGVEVGFAHTIYLASTQTLVLLESELKDQYRGRGIGTRLYLEAIKEGKIESKGQPFQFIPDYLHGGKTNQSALRLWDSLARRFKSSSHKIYIT
jgi:predicted GNAT family acetyltransferase